MLAAAIAVSYPLILHLARGMTFSLDELDWFMTSPGLNLERALEPHSGHLVLTTRLVSKVVLEAFGSSYVPFMLLTVTASASLALLLFVYAGRRVGPLAALPPILVLLFFGSDAVHVVTGNGFTVLLALACGVGALLALERDDRRGEVAACALLCVGVATYTVALPFVMAVAVLVLLRGDRWRRAWIFAVPALLYAAWLVWARGAAADPGSEIAISNALLLPSWAFQSLAAALTALVGLDYEFGEESVVARAGPVLALVAVGALMWRLRRGAVPPGLWATLAAILTLWMMGALSAAILRVPTDPRYLYPVAVGLLLVAAWAAADLRWTRGGLIALYAVAAIGLATNLNLLRERAADYRSGHEVVRAEMTGIEVAGERVDPDFDLPAATGGRSFWSFPFALLSERGESPVELYVTATQRYGPLGFSPAALGEQHESRRERADSVLVAALGLELVPTEQPNAGDCLQVEEGLEQGIVHFELPAGSAAVLQPRGGEGPVAVRRFATDTGVELGELRPGQAAVLELPDDGLPEPWRASAPGASLLVCPLR